MQLAPSLPLLQLASDPPTLSLLPGQRCDLPLRLLHCGGPPVRGVTLQLRPAGTPRLTPLSHLNWYEMQPAMLFDEAEDSRLASRDHFEIDTKAVDAQLPLQVRILPLPPEVSILPLLLEV